jgi:hypothetical protein
MLNEQVDQLDWVEIRGRGNLGPVPAIRAVVTS